LKDSWSRERVIETINLEGMPCYRGSCSEIYLEKAFWGKFLGPAKWLPVAKMLGETSLMFLVHPTLREEALDWTGQVVGRILEKASR
jgi:dTDP-4-amino-4,6-dideoxygalactose transaminase